MSEALDRMRGIRQLPLFPLPVVLFPGTPLPLHIFEPRYRQMLADIQITNNLFALPYFDASEQEESRPALGAVGCVAELRDVQTLPDGRSNILTVGVVRCVLEDYAATDEQYLIGELSYFEDEPEDEEFLAPRANVVQELFMRVARAAREIAGDRTELPDLPEISPEQLSYFVAAAVDFDAPTKLELLKMRSTSERLKRLHEFLTQAVQTMEDRARMGKLSQSNGHSKKKIDIE